MSEFKLSQERVTSAINIIVQFLRDAGYAGSVEDGTGLNDVVVKPSAVVYDLLAQMVDKAYAYQSLSKALELKNTIGQDEFDAAVDGILSNWFVTRNDGKPAYGTLRMWFLQPLEFLHYRDGQAVGAVDSINVVADGEQGFSETDGSCILNSTSKVNEYYVDVAVRTSTFTDIAPTENSSINVTCNDIYYLRTTIPGNFVAGILVESSEDFIRRTEKAITTRELITDRAINTVLRENFDEIVALYVARYGSREQLRDIVTFQGVTVHVGNKADIYIGSPLTRMTVEVQADEDGSIDTAQLPGSTSVVSYLEAKDADGNAIDLTLQVDEKTWLSTGCLPEKLIAPTSGPVKLTLLTDPVLRSIHEFVYSETQRVACYDPMVKHMFPMLLYPELIIERVNPDEDSTATIKKAVMEYVNQIVKDRAPLVCSELVAKVHSDVPNVKKIRLPLICQTAIFDPMSNRVIETTVQDKFTVDDHLDLNRSPQTTSGTVQFYTDADMISVSYA